MYDAEQHGSGGGKRALRLRASDMPLLLDCRLGGIARITASLDRSEAGRPKPPRRIKTLVRSAILRLAAGNPGLPFPDAEAVKYDSDITNEQAAARRVGTEWLDIERALAQYFGGKVLATNNTRSANLVNPDLNIELSCVMPILYETPQGEHLAIDFAMTGPRPNTAWLRLAAISLPFCRDFEKDLVQGTEHPNHATPADMKISVSRLAFLSRPGVNEAYEVETIDYDRELKAATLISLQGLYHDIRSTDLTPNPSSRLCYGCPVAACPFHAQKEKKR